MKIDEIKAIVNADLPDDFKRRGILRLMAKDESVIPELLEILNIERKAKKVLLTDMNALLSKSHVALEIATFDKKGLNGDGFIQREIMEFYLNNKDTVGHCFKDLSKLP